MEKRSVFKSIFARKWIRRLLDLGVLAAIFFAITKWQQRDLISTDGKTQAPQFEVVDLEGKLFNLDEHKGQRLLLYFFAPWCGVCKASAGNLVDLQSDRADVSIVAVAMDFETKSEISNFAAAYIPGIRVVLGHRALGQLYRISGYPTYYIIDEDNYVVGANMGFSTEAGMRLRL